MSLYIIYHCNQWHEYSSFRLIGVVDGEHLDKALRKIKKELGYDDQDMTDFIDIVDITVNDLDI